MKSGKKEIKAFKIEAWAERARRFYGIADENDPTIEVGGVRGAEGEYIAKGFTKDNLLAEHIIRVKIGASYLTIAHEIAHWVQQCIEGETYCFSCKNVVGKGAEKIRHYEIEQEVIGLARAIDNA